MYLHTFETNKRTFAYFLTGNIIDYLQAKCILGLL